MQQCCVWRPKHRPRGFICDQNASFVDALCVMHCVMHHCCGRLGVAVAVGMGNTLGPGETGRRCMVISRGASTRDLTGPECGKRRGPQRGVCAPATTKSRGFFLQSGRLAIACFFICKSCTSNPPLRRSRGCGRPAVPRSSPLFAPRPRSTWVSRQTARQVVNSNCRRAVTPASRGFPVGGPCFNHF